MNAAATWLWLAASFLIAAPVRGDDAPPAQSSPLDQLRALGRIDKPPVVHRADGFEPDGELRPLFFEGLPYQGKPTRVFAWYGSPSQDQQQTGDEKAKDQVPGVILVHGGGGTAYREWVRKWNDQGFAALAIAVEGQTDEHEGDGKSWKRHRWAGPARQGIYADADEPIADQWMFHAVADVALAHELLKSFPEVDAERIGVCGISWGGVIVSTAAGVVDRLAFAIPIYGCGALDQSPNQYGRELADNQTYREVFDPCLTLPHAKMPILWLTWLRDSHFPLDSQRASYRAASGPRMVAVLPEMGHSHPAGWNPPESYEFAKSVTSQGRPWLSQRSQGLEKGVAFAEFETRRPIKNAKLYSTSDDGFTGQRQWRESPAKFETVMNEGVRASASLPVGTLAYFFNVEADGLIASSEYAETKDSFPGNATSTTMATIDTTLKTASRQIRQFAFDGDDHTFFASEPVFDPHDHFTLAFDQPVAIESIEVATGRPDDGDRLDSGSLELSADGQSFVKVAEFHDGKAQAQFEGRKCRAIRIAPTAESNSPLVVREIALKSEPTVTSFRYPVEFVTDVADAPEMKDWAEKTARECERFYAMINEELKSDNDQPPQWISISLKNDYGGVAMASGNRITGSVKYFRSHPDDIGAMIHETVHVAQRYRSRNNPSWLVEGVADYVRFYKYEPSKAGRLNPDRARFDGSYRTTAAFLAYLVEKYDKTIVLKINRLMRQGQYKATVFKEWTGKTLEELGEEWRATLRKQGE